MRERFKDLPNAIVTHGREQFALTNKNQLANRSEHQNIRALMQDSKIQIHVCGTLAGWHGLSTKGFPDYVNVFATGPAQINDYKALDYLLLVIRSKNLATD